MLASRRRQNSLKSSLSARNPTRDSLHSLHLSSSRPKFLKQELRLKMQALQKEHPRSQLLLKKCHLWSCRKSRMWLKRWLKGRRSPLRQLKWLEPTIQVYLRFQSSKLRKRHRIYTMAVFRLSSATIASAFLGSLISMASSPTRCIRTQLKWTLTRKLYCSYLSRIGSCESSGSKNIKRHCSELLLKKRPIWVHWKERLSPSSSLSTTTSKSLKSHSSTSFTSRKMLSFQSQSSVHPHF